MCYFLWVRDYDGPCDFVTHSADGSEQLINKHLNEGNTDIILSDPIQESIISKVLNYMSDNDIEPVSTYVSPRWTY